MDENKLNELLGALDNVSIYSDTVTEEMKVAEEPKEEVKVIEEAEVMEVTLEALSTDAPLQYTVEEIDVMIEEGSMIVEDYQYGLIEELLTEVINNLDSYTDEYLLELAVNFSDLNGGTFLNESIDEMSDEILLEKFMDSAKAALNKATAASKKATVKVKRLFTVKKSDNDVDDFVAGTGVRKNRSGKAKASLLTIAKDKVKSKITEVKTKVLDKKKLNKVNALESDVEKVVDSINDHTDKGKVLRDSLSKENDKDKKKKIMSDLKVWGSESKALYAKRWGLAKELIAAKKTLKTA